MKNLKIYKNNFLVNKKYTAKVNDFYSFVLIPVSVGCFIYNISNDFKISLVGTSYTLGYNVLKRFRKKVLFYK